MKNFPNIEGRKNRVTNAYTGYGGGHVWTIWRTTWKGWIASSNTATFIIKGRVLDDISAKLAALPDRPARWAETHPVGIA